MLYHGAGRIQVTSLLRALKRAAGVVAALSSARLKNNREALRSYRKLHVGSASKHIPGFLNVDAQPLLGVDLVCDLLELERYYPPANAELIYACHVLEHFSTTDSKRALAMFYRLLAPGGELRISVPDIDRIVKIYLQHWEHFQTPGNSPWVGLIYGGQTDQYDFHRTGFNLCWLTYQLESIGFHGVEEYPHEPHFLSIEDASLANEPFGKYISLNARAFK